MHEQFVSRAVLSAAMVWVFAIALMIAAWAVMGLSDQWKLAGLLAASSLMTTGAAVALQQRVYIARLCALVRHTAGLERRPDAEVHALR